MRIGILYPVSYLDSVPSIYNTIIMLSRYGFLVEVFVLEGGEQFPTVQFLESGVVLHTLPLKERRGLLSCIPNILTFTTWAWNLCRGNKFICFIGVDPPGLIAATALGLIYRTPWVYFSLELILSTDSVRMYHNYKQLEVWSSRRSSLIIIQDEVRARLMAEDNNIPMSRFAYLPNSPLGPAHRCPTTYLHKLFGFTAKDKIMLHAGSMADWVLSRELALAVQNLPEQWRLVFQTRSNFHDVQNYLGKVLKNNRVFVSSYAVSIQTMDELVSSADIGIALYKVKESPNILYMGKSSGKICQYLHCGLPVIATRMPWWEEMLQHYNSGISIDSPSAILVAIEQIFTNYDRFSQGAQDHFENELRFEPAFANIVSRLDRLAYEN
jgi:glycosyltransferase involved in cell wall biosynthesis